ncbi:MAG: cytochrome c oxidase assembly protein [Pseudonocardiaceae bacterium]
MTTQPAERGTTRAIQPWVVAGVAATAAVAAAVMVLRLGGGVDLAPVPGLPRRDATVLWLVGLLRITTDVLAVVTVGCLLAAAFLVPGDGRLVSVHGYRWLRGAGIAAALWSLAAFAGIPVTLADILATSLGEGVSLPGVRSFVTSVPQGTSLAIAALLAAVVAVGCRVAITVSGAAALTGVAVAALLPPVLTGHVVSAGDHKQAVNFQVLHVTAAALWAGGLLALLLARRLQTGLLASAAARYSTLALACFLVVGASGLGNVVIRFTAPAELVTSGYGRAVLVKSAALLLLAGFGWWHRRRTLPALEAGSRRAFVRLATAEVIVFGATVGVAAALSRTPPPPGDVPTSSLTRSLLGFDMPGPPTVRAVLLDWYPDPLFLGVAGAAVGCYLLGVRRLRSAGQHWAAARTAAWLLGWVLVTIATSSSLSRYTPVLISGNVLQHLILASLAPLPLVLGAPLALARRSLPPTDGHGPRTARAWIDSAATSPPARLLRRPVIAFTLYALALYPVYLPGVYGTVLRSYTAQLLIATASLAAGSLFVWHVTRGPARPLTRTVLLGAAAVGHGSVGVVLIRASTPLGPGWFSALERAWGPDLLADQRLGGLLFLLVGAAALLLLLAAVACSHREPGPDASSTAGPVGSRPPAPAGSTHG